MTDSITKRVIAYLKKQPGTPEEIGKALGLSMRGKNRPWLGYRWGRWNFAKAEKEGIIEWTDGKWRLKWRLKEAEG